MTDNSLIATSAPVEYDYGYAKQVGKGTYFGKPVRLVQVPTASLDYQAGRYASGMYAAVTNSFDFFTHVKEVEMFPQTVTAPSTADVVVSYSADWGDFSWQAQQDTSEGTAYGWGTTPLGAVHDLKVVRQ